VTRIGARLLMLLAGRARWVTKGRRAGGSRWARPAEADGRLFTAIRSSAPATLRGHERSGPAPVRTWPVGMKWLARLDIAPARRQVARRTLDGASGRVPPPPGPAPRPSRAPIYVRAKPPEIPGPAGRAAPRSALTRPKPACRGSSCPRPARTPGQTTLFCPRLPCLTYPRPGRAAGHWLATRLKQTRNTMSGRSRSVVYGVTVGKRERNPLMGNMKRSRRTLKWPAGFS
jgi:hypothetical protein